MSFDLKIEGNDLTINPDGTIATVRNNSKLAQDIIKAILTPLGSNRFFRWYGSVIGTRTIGQLLDASMTEMEVTRSIQDTISNIISLQKTQAKYQYVSPGETIAALQDILVLRHPSDPRQYEVTISVLTRQLTVVEETFSLRV